VKRALLAGLGQTGPEPKASESRGLERHVGPGPGALKARLDDRRLCRPVLSPEALGEAVERPATGRTPPQVLAVDFFGLGRLSRLEHDGTERLTHGVIIAAMRANLGDRRKQVLDARSPGRFMGAWPEPRTGLRGGHLPGSLNLPYEELYQTDDTFIPPDALRQAFVKSGVALGKPLVTSCGSGITACVLALGLHLAGHDQVAVYDGSWTEWGGRQDTPIENPAAGRDES
jgi:rhodanese-related sulfurtransferase